GPPAYGPAVPGASDAPTGSPRAAGSGSAVAARPAEPMRDRTTATNDQAGIRLRPIRAGVSRSGTISPRRLNSPRTRPGAVGSLVSRGALTTSRTASIGTAYRSGPTGTASALTAAPDAARRLEGRAPRSRWLRRRRRL